MLCAILSQVTGRWEAEISSAKVPGTLSELEQQPTSAFNDSDTLSSYQLYDPDLHPIIVYL